MTGHPFVQRRKRQLSCENFKCSQNCDLFVLLQPSCLLAIPAALDECLARYTENIPENTSKGMLQC